MISFKNLIIFFYQYLQADTSRIVYSWNDELPTVTQNSDRSETYTFRQHQNQGSASINLLGGLPNPPQIPSDAKSFTVKDENVCHSIYQ